MIIPLVVLGILALSLTAYGVHAWRDGRDRRKGRTA